MSSFEYRCDRCGKVHLISLTRAGTVLGCVCGVQIALPSLSQLRKHAGMAAYEKPTTETITEMVADGRLPESLTCVSCSARCDELPLVAICERTRSRTHSTGGGGGVNGFAVGFVSGIPFCLPLIGGGSRGQVTEEQIGRDVVAPVPMRVCDRCWSEANGHRANVLLRRGTLSLGIAAAVSLMLWFMEPVLGFGVPFTWTILFFGGAVVFWIVKRWYSSKSTIAVKSLLQKTPIYRDLCEEYPDLEIVAGHLDEYSG